MGNQRANTEPIYESLACRLLPPDPNIVVLQRAHPWVEHLTSLPKKVDPPSSVFTHNHDRASMSCLQRPNIPEANNWTHTPHNRAARVFKTKS